MVGSLLLLWASKRAGSHLKYIVWGLVAMIVFLFGGQGLAIVTGLASGATPPTGWPFILVITSLVLYSVALIETCVSGISLVKKL